MDQDAFARLFFSHAARLVRLAGFLGAAEPEDVVQEAYCNVLLRRSHLHGAESEAVGYLTRSVVNEVRDRHRRHQVASKKAHLVAADGVFVPSGSEFWLDLSYDDVAHAMGVRTGTAKSQVSRALVALRSWSADLEDEGQGT